MPRDSTSESLDRELRTWLQEAGGVRSVTQEPLWRVSYTEAGLPTSGQIQEWITRRRKVPGHQDHDGQDPPGPKDKPGPAQGSRTDLNEMLAVTRTLSEISEITGKTIPSLRREIMLNSSDIDTLYPEIAERLLSEEIEYAKSLLNVPEDVKAAYRKLRDLDRDQENIKAAIRQMQDRLQNLRRPARTRQG